MRNIPDYRAAPLPLLPGRDDGDSAASPPAGRRFIDAIGLLKEKFQFLPRFSSWLVFRVGVLVVAL